MQDFSQLKPIKQFNQGKHSSKVILLEENIVAKHHSPKETEFFEIERKILEQLKGCPFVPQLLYADKKERILYMTYCGEPVPLWDKQVKDQVKVLVKELKHKWGVKRAFFSSKLPKRHNVCLKDGRIFLIDFNSGQWLLK